MVLAMVPMPAEDEPEERGALHPPYGYQDIVSDGWTCTACGVTIPRNDVLTRHHQNWHRELERRLAGTP
jgi:hypothetical protein